MDCRGIFFDLYGTLLLYGDMRAAWADWLASFHTSLSAAGLVVERDTLAAGLDGFFGGPDPPAKVRGRTLFERRVVTACDAMGLHPTDAQVAVISDSAVNAWQGHVTVDPHANDVLTRLGTSFSLALVSNFDHGLHVHTVLRETGFVDHFAAVVISGEVGVRKPDPRIFDGALAATGLRPEEVTYVGDADVDIVAARAAGIRPIRVCRDLVEPGTDIHDFRSGPHQGTGAEAPPRDDVLEIRCLTALVELFAPDRA